MKKVGQNVENVKMSKMENRYHCVICRTKRYESKLVKVVDRWVCSIDNVSIGTVVKSVPIVYLNTFLYVSSCAYNILELKQGEIDKANRDYLKINNDLIHIGVFKD